VSRKRVARLMRAKGLVGVSRRRKVRTTRRAPGEQRAPDLVRRNFTATALRLRTTATTARRALSARAGIW